MDYVSRTVPFASLTCWGRLLCTMFSHCAGEGGGGDGLLMYKQDFEPTDRSVALALLQIAFLGMHDDKGLGPRGWRFSCLPDLLADCCESK